MSMIPRKLVRWFEVGGIFVGVPLLLMGDFVPPPKSLVLLAVCISCLVLLLRDKTFDRRRFGLNGYHSWRTLLIRFVIIASCLTLSLVLVQPGIVLATLRHHPALWMRIMIAYPVLSVVPQEIIYRAFFFHRYGSLLAHENISIVANAVLFAFAHILFRNWIAIVGSFVASLLWAMTYVRSRSLLVVSIEHALYGNIVFTLGIGHYFYSPDF
ncbi:MAG TPA: CPBP family intramembrane glutamic endopeptidase [Nitrospirota bacterium]|nr:CPBP family intramembrane glutamic endopeptidase [Nitrospirota bacterium]